MINLIHNENMKLAHSISTWIMMGILVLIVVTVGLVSRFGGSEAPKNDWKATITVETQSMKKSLESPQISERRKDILTKEIQINEYRLKNNLPPVQSDSLWGFVEWAANNMISIIALFAIVMGGGIVANEFSGGTIKLLLIRPSKRWKILLSKYISIIGYTILMLLVLLILAFVLGGTLFSFKGAGMSYLTNIDGKVTEVNMIMHILELCGLQCISLIMMVTLAFMISTVFRNSAMAIGIGVFLFTVGSSITMLLASRYTWAKFILFANTDLTQYISGEPLITGMTMTFSIIVLVVYFMSFNVISYLGFTKRDVVA